MTTVNDFKRWCEENPNPLFPDFIEAERIVSENNIEVFIEVKGRSQSGDNDMTNVSLWIESENGFKVLTEEAKIFRTNNAVEQAKEYAKELKKTVKNSKISDNRVIK